MTARKHGETTVFDGAISDREKHQCPARIHLDKPVILMPAIVAGTVSFLDAKGRRRDQQVRANDVFNWVEKPGIADQPVNTFEKQIDLEIERPAVVRIVALEGLNPVTQIARLGRLKRWQRGNEPLALECIDLFRVSPGISTSNWSSVSLIHGHRSRSYRTIQELFPYIGKARLLRQWAGIIDMTPITVPQWGSARLTTYLDAGAGHLGFQGNAHWRQDHGGAGCGRPARPKKTFWFLFRTDNPAGLGRIAVVPGRNRRKVALS